MLAEAAEYVGVDIKPYQYIKTTAVPAVSQQVKLAAETVTEGVKKITGLTVAADKTNNRPGNQAGQPDDASVKLESKKIVFETMTDIFSLSSVSINTSKKFDFSYGLC